MSPRAVVPVALAALAASCSILGIEDPQRDELGDARARWERVGPESYRTTETLMCFCGSERTRPVVIEVTPAGVARHYADDGAAVPESLHPVFPTVAGLFDEIEEALEQGADRVEVRYDPATGAPLEVFVDQEERAVDEEFRYTLTLPEPL